LHSSDEFQNDRIFISHRHDPEDGFPNLEDMGDGYISDDRGSGSNSVQISEKKALGTSRSTRLIDSEVETKESSAGACANPV
jgi:hypothetical protein